MLRSLAFNIAFYAFTLVWALGVLLLLWIPGRRHVQWLIALYARIVIVLARVIAGIRLEVRGAENIPRDRACLIVAKHMSDFDPIVTFAMLSNMTALAKKELFAIPVIGWILRKLGIIRIDRQAGNAHQGMPQALAAIRAAGRPLIVYPEGTRTRPGERRKLKSGIFHLAQDGDLPVIPVSTNSGLHWPKGRARRRPGTVIYEIGAPLDIHKDKAVFMRRIEREVIDRSDRLMAEDPAAPSSLVAELQPDPQRSRDGSR